MAEDARVRVGIVGLGAVAQAVHLPILARRPELFAITALCDASAATLSALGDRYGVPLARRHTALEDLLAAGELDGLLILTSGSHGGAAIAALDAGLAVMAEKPLAYTLAEADALDGHPQVDRLQLGYMKLYDPAVQRAVRLLRDQSMEVRAVDVTVLHPTSASQLAHARLLPAPVDVPAGVVAAWARETDDLRRTALGEAADAFGRLYTGVLLGSIVHDLSLLSVLVGDPASIDHVDAWRHGTHQGSVGITGRLDGGARFSIAWHYLPDHPAYHEELRIHHETGTIGLVFPSPYLLHAPTSFSSTDSDGDAELFVGALSTREAFESELEAFHALVTRGERPLAGVADGRREIVTCQRIVRRLAEQRGMTVGGEAAGHPAEGLAPSAVLAVPAGPAGVAGVASPESTVPGRPA